MTTTVPVKRATSTRPVDPATGKWAGPKRPYDLAKEFTIAFVVVGLLSMGLAAVFSSPDEKNMTLQDWSKNAPSDFVVTATAELAGTTTSAGYGPPYNTAADGQAIGPIMPAKWAGVTIPVDPANDFVVAPLTTLESDQTVAQALTQWKGASADQQATWTKAYSDALTAAPDNDPAKVAAGDYGPVPAMGSALLAMAQRGALDSQIVSAGPGFFETDYTRPMLFLADGAYFDDTAGNSHLHGDQWGMMNETGNWPGQAWLWLASFWYQIPPFTTEGTVWADNADLIILALVTFLSLLMILVPLIPGLRSIPKLIPIYKLVWRGYYRRLDEQGMKKGA